MRHACQPAPSFHPRQSDSFGGASDITAKPVLLRITTDLFTTKSRHSADEIVQFQEIAQYLIADVDGPSLLPVAVKLSRHLDTPSLVIAALLQRGGEVAAAVFELCSHVDRALLMDTAKWGDHELAKAIARRPSFDDALTRVLCERPEEAVVMALLDNPAVTFDSATAAYLMRRARKSPMLAQGLAARSDLVADMTPLFLWAAPAVRGDIILAARRMDLGERSTYHATSTENAAHLRLERLALARQTPDFEEALAQDLGCSRDAIDLVMQDEGGESLTIALAAVGMPKDMIARVLMMADPAISHSTERMKSLTDLAGVLALKTAKRLAAEILDAHPARNSKSALQTAIPSAFASRAQVQITATERQEASGFPELRKLLA